MTPDGDALAAAFDRLDFNRRTEMPEHPLGVVPGRLRLDHRRLSRRVQPGEQHRGFDLRRGYWQVIFDRDGVYGAADREWQASAFTRHKARSETAQRLDDAAHRPPPQRSVAGDESSDRVRAKNAEQEARAGPG